MLAGEDSRRDPGREFAKQAIVRLIQIVKFVLLTHRSSLRFLLNVFLAPSRINQDLP
jgi:hypothetical protein